MLKILQYAVSAKFGAIDQIHKVPHKGLDLATPIGTSVQAPMDGTISRIFMDPGTGLCVQEKLADGTVLTFGHLSKVGVTFGQKVKQGAEIALTGNSGTATTGPHVHVMAQTNAGAPFDPTAILNGAAATNVGFWDNSHGLLWNAWHILSTPGADMAYGEGAKLTGWDWIKEIADPVAIVLALILILLMMLGSKRAGKWLYWDIAIYIVFRLVASCI